MSEPAPTPAPTRRWAPAVCWGIDPGARAGAAVLVSVDVGEKVGPGDVTVLAAVAWRYPRGGRPRMSDRLGRDDEMLDLYSVGRSAAFSASLGLPPGKRLVVAMEKLFVGKSPDDSITLAEAAGEVVVGFRRSTDLPVLRPHPSTWRAKMLGSASLSAKAAAARAVQVAEHLAPGQLGALSTNDHAADALCIAVWGAIESRRG